MRKLQAAVLPASAVRRFLTQLAMVGVLSCAASTAGTVTVEKLPVPPARQCTDALRPTGLIRNEWMRVGGPNGPIGCPTRSLREDGNGSVMSFEHGQIAISPGVWENGVVAAYQDGGGIMVDWTVSWTNPSHFNYDKFLVRWDYNGAHHEDGDPCNGLGDGDQCEVLDDMGDDQYVLLHYKEDTHLRTKGTFALPVDHGDGNYRIVVEGCDGRKLRSSRCRQKWMHEVNVAFRRPVDGSDMFRIDLRTVPAAHTVAESRAGFFRRAAAITLYNACRLLPYNVYRNEESYMTVALAKLAYSDFYLSDFCPGREVANRNEVIASVRDQRVESKAGTTIDSCPGCRTGEYDVALVGYVAMVDAYRRALPPNVTDHIVNDLLNKRGALDRDDLHVGPAPESENHVLMIETTRYLTNDVLFARNGQSSFDNGANGMTAWMLNHLQKFMQTDFIEYNARPYQGYSDRALQNLYTFARDQRVKTAAGMVLDYISAKMAISSNDDRRAAPYRRKREYNEPNLIGFRADPQSMRMLGLVGDIDILRQSPRGDLYAPWYGQDDMQLAVLSAYRIPDIILDALINHDHRIFYQGLHHYADELYAGEPSFLLSAGGHYATSAYKVAGIGKGDDIGKALPTTLMPTGRFIVRDDLVRFEGVAQDDLRSNMCVAPSFACGIRPVIPRAMTPGAPDCYESRAAAAGAPLQKGTTHQIPWTFLNFSGTCGGNSPYGMYVAVYHQADYGFLEAFDTKVNPALSFDRFVSGVLERNQHRHYSQQGTNTYVTTTGEEVDFVIAPSSSVTAIRNGPPVAQTTSQFATGSTMTSRGSSGVVTFANPYVGESVTLDDVVAMRPTVSYTNIAVLTPTSCRVGFVWREAFGGDTVCVPTATRTRTAAENTAAAGHRDPNGGAFGPDTCLAGFVWREASNADHVCVQPALRSAAAFDNLLAPSRRALP